MAFDVGAVAGGLDIVVEFFEVEFGWGEVHREFDEGVFGRDDHVGRAEDGVWSCGEDTEGFAHFRVVWAEDWEVDFRADGASDPFGLLGFGGGWPVEVCESVEEAVGVCGDAEHPLAERFAVDWVGPAFGEAVDDFFVGECGSELWAPVDGLLGEVGESVGVDDCFFGFSVERVPWSGVGAVGEVSRAGVFRGVWIELRFARAGFEVRDEFCDGSGFAVSVVGFDIEP